MPLELAETRPRFNFPESRNAFSKVRSAKLNTDVKISMPGTDYFGETALKQDIIYLSTPCGNHTITHFRYTGSGLHSNLKWYYDQKIISFFSSDFESLFTKDPTGKILSFVFYPKAAYFECKFWISRSAITHVQN